MAAGQSTFKEQCEQRRTDADAALRAHRYAEAEKQFRELVQLQLRVLGPEHKDTLDSQTSHAFSLTCLKRYAEEEAILRQVLQVQQLSPMFGMEHERTLKSVRALGGCLLHQRRYKEAEPMLRKVHALDVRVLGPRHAETLVIQGALGQCLLGGSQFEEAERLLRDALEGCQALGEDPRDPLHKPILVGAAMNNLADCLFKTGQLVEAESLLRAAVKYTRHHLDEHTITISCMSRHAVVLSKLEKHAEAEVMFRLAVQASRAAFGWESPSTLPITRDLMTCLLAQQKVAPAEALVRDHLSHLQQALGENHPYVVDWTIELAKLLEKQCHGSKRSEAKALMRRVRELIRTYNRGLAPNRQDRPWVVH